MWNSISYPSDSKVTISVYCADKTKKEGKDKSSSGWKQPKYPLTDEWIKKMWYVCVFVCVCVCVCIYIYIMEYYSAIKKNEIMLFAATWMHLEIIILSEISQTERDTNII